MLGSVAQSDRPIFILATKGFFCYTHTMKHSHTTTEKKKKVMHFRPSLFWDVDPKTIDPKRHTTYIAERIMDFGFDAEARWLLETYPRAVLYRIAKTSRVLQEPTRALWSKLLKTS